MKNLTASQVAMLIGVSVYTVKRWYNWYEDLTSDELNNLIKEGMPILPEYQTIGNTNWRYWKEEDIELIKKFKEWVPRTKNGVMSNKKKGIN